MAVLLFDLALGVALVATVPCAGRLAAAASLARSSRMLGVVLIAVPLPLAVAVQVFAPLRPLLAEATFVVGVAAFAAGAVLVLAGDDADELGGAADPEPPPWWPEFEREFASYARRRRRTPKVLA